LERRSPFFFVKLIKIAFEEGGFDQKKTKHGMAAVRTMGFASDATGKCLFHLVKGLIRP
jgi:hypothetical protein